MRRLRRLPPERWAVGAGVMNIRVIWRGADHGGASPAAPAVRAKFVRYTVQTAMFGTSPPRAKARWRRAERQACTREMRDGKRPIAATDTDTPGETTDTDNLRSQASSSTPPSTDTVGLAPRTHPSKRRRTRGGLSEGGGSSSSDTSAGSVSLLFGVPAEVAALMIKHCDPADFAALCMCCRALHTLVEQARILLTLTLADPPHNLNPNPNPNPHPNPNPNPHQGLRLRSVEKGYALPQALPVGEARCHERVQLILSLERRRAHLG